MSSEAKVALLVLIGAPVVVGACKLIDAIREASVPVATPVAWSALPPPPPPRDLASAAVVASAIANQAPSARSMPGHTKDSTISVYPGPPEVHVLREKGTGAAQATVSSRDMDPGPSEFVCMELGEKRVQRVTRGPLAGYFFTNEGPLGTQLTNEDFVRRHMLRSCAHTASCKSRRGLPDLFTPDNFVMACQKIVRDQLKAPSRAEFPGAGEAPKPEFGQNCVLSVDSWVDAPNEYNAMLRAKWTCSWDPATDRMNAKLLPLA